MMPQRSNLTDRAKRYRAQNAVRGEHRCVLCNARGRLDVMHLDGNESHGEPANLAHGCRSCNGKLAAAFKRIGAGVPTNQYNPAKGGVPSFAQYCWAVTQQQHSGEHGEAGAVIHATPRSKRIDYARRIADMKSSRRNMWPFGEGQILGSRVYHGKARGSARRASAPKLTARQEAKARREQESERLESKLSDRELNRKLQQHYARGGNLAEYLQANPGLRPLAKLYREYEQIVQRIGSERNVKRLQSLIDKRDMVARELARLGFRVNPGQNNPDPVTASFLGEQLGKVASKLKKKVTGNPGESVKVTIAPSARRKGSFDVFVGGVHRVTKPTLKGAEGYAQRIQQANPADAAASMYQKFHGRPSGEVVQVDEPVHYHAHLAALGELEKLTVKSNDGGLVDLEGFGDAVLCSNERGTQLYIEGGDQAVKLSAFGIGKPYHDVEDLGEVTKLWYFTTKDHLGEQGGEASYHHTLSEEKKTRMAYWFGECRVPKPRLLYDTLNQSLAFAGGEYTVEPEGIRN